MLLNTTEETWENLMRKPPLKIKQENSNMHAIFRRKKLPPQKNNLRKKTIANLQLYAAAWSISGPLNVLLN